MRMKTVDGEAAAGFGGPSRLSPFDLVAVPCTSPIRRTDTTA